MRFCLLSHWEFVSGKAEGSPLFSAVSSWVVMVGQQTGQPSKEPGFLQGFIPTLQCPVVGGWLSRITQTCSMQFPAVVHGCISQWCGKRAGLASFVTAVNYRVVKESRIDPFPGFLQDWQCNTSVSGFIMDMCTLGFQACGYTEQTFVWIGGGKISIFLCQYKGWLITPGTAAVHLKL